MTIRPSKRKTLRGIFLGWRKYVLLKEGVFINAFLSENRFLSLYTVPVFHGQKRDKADTSSRRKPGKSLAYSYVAYRFTGHPDSEQEVLLRRNCGCARWLWNRYVADYRDGKKLILPAHVKNEPGVEWLKEADSQALCNVQLAFQSAKSRYERGECGKPRFKKKHLSRESYTTNRMHGGDNVCFKDGMLTLPKIKNPIRLTAHRTPVPGGTLKSVTVSLEDGGKWMFSLLFEYPKREEAFSDNVEGFLETGNSSSLRHVGLDMSLPDLFVSSDGRRPEYELNGVMVRFEKQYRKLEKRIAKEQRRLSRMEKDSANYRKQCEKIARLYAKTKHARQDFLSQLAVRLADAYDVITIEDLDMSAMKRTLRLGKSVSDNGWGYFIQVLERKMLERGHLLLRVGRFFPSSKTCLKCGHVHKELKLSDRTYICPACGHVMDRDVQAAVNIDREGLRLLKEIFLIKKDNTAGSEKIPA